MKKQALIVLGLFLILLYPSISQAQWKWGNQSIGSNPFGSLITPFGTDIQNTIYSSISFQNTLTIGDTTYSFNSGYANYDYVIGKHFSNGEFKEFIPIHSDPGRMIGRLELIIEPNSNLYIGTEFNHHLFIADTMLNYTPQYYESMSDVVVIKLNRNNKLLWSRLIYSDLDDQVISTAQSKDSSIYVGSMHFLQNADRRVYYFSQDSSEYHQRDILSLTKIDQEGTLLWHKEIFSPNSSVYGREMKLGDNGTIYFFGSSHTDVIVENDTILFPYEDFEKSLHFIVSFNSEGQLTDGFFIDQIFIEDFTVDSNSNIIFAGSIQDTAIFNNDTIIVPENKERIILFQLDSLHNVVWDIQSSDVSLPQLGFFQLKTYSDRTTFFSEAKGSFTLGNQNFDLGNYNQLFFGNISQDGVLDSIITTNSNNIIWAKGYIFDNCGNSILGGAFKGDVCFGKDSLQPTYNDIYDGFLAKYQTSNLEVINIANDSSVCDEYSFLAPSNYSFYSINDSLLTHNNYKINVSGVYRFGVANENGCWHYDTVNIYVEPKPVVNLGPDNTISLLDSIVLSTSPDFDSYLWFDGTTNNSNTIMGNYFGTGNYPFWLEVTEGPCTIRDTVEVSILSPGDYETGDLLLFPNPFSSKLSLIARPDFEQIEIFDISGNMLRQEKINITSTQIINPNTDFLPSGTYVIKIQTGKDILTGKIVKINTQ